MNRRLAFALAGALTLVGLSSCSTVRPNAAVVGDVEIRRSDFERDMQKLGGNVTSSIDQVRSWLTDRIRFATAARALSDLRLAVTDADRAKGEEMAKQAWTTYDTLPASLKTRVRDGFAAEAALAAAQPIPTDQTVSDALGGEDGPLCLTVIPAKDENDAKAALADLTAGKAVADVVGPRVAGSELAATKGAVVNDDGTCPLASQLNEQITAALGAVKLNTPSPPVQITTSSGQKPWFIFVPTRAGNGDVKAILAGLKAAAVPVSVDVRYGHWDTDTQTVIAGGTTDVG